MSTCSSSQATVPQDTSGAFEVVGNFVVNEPDVTYTVNCPEYSAGAMCSVEETQDCGLIYTADGIGNDADLKEECADVTYKIGLKLVTANGLPHFSLLASRGSDLDINEGCPAMIMFEGSGGKKATKTFSIGHDENIHFFGDNTLKALLEAESKVDAIPWDDHNFLDNTCAHYAGHIVNGLGFEVTNEVAEFIGCYLVQSQEYRKTVEEQMKKSGARRILFENDGLWKEFVMGNVYTQAQMVLQN
jgi:hypothetical protein